MATAPFSCHPLPRKIELYRALQDRFPDFRWKITGRNKDGSPLIRFYNRPTIGGKEVPLTVALLEPLDRFDSGVPRNLPSMPKQAPAKRGPRLRAGLRLEDAMG